ncbi:MULTISPECIES: tetratricopeptide repeat protein [Flavobacteriaceae]|uniref:tetratricopeptide repeat protein n=1 Tax=Flavobacteriaceae TaxID=49546 RepID=UPI0014910A2B|nr:MULTISPECIES: tetratricopeptide repeat protein [Allomuricauda]MDC6367078.1 tetratricopeptide repeat protein [Muricauda sp. AC10]
MKNRLPKYFIIFFLFSIAYGQNSVRVDSLLVAYDQLPFNEEKVSTLRKLYHATKHFEPKLAYGYAHESIDISRKINFAEGEGLGYLCLADYYSIIAHIDSAKFYYGKTIRTFEKTDDNKNLWLALNELAKFKTLQGDFEHALDLANQGIITATKLKSGIKLIDNYQRKSTIYMDKGDFQSAMTEALNASKVVDTLKVHDATKEAIVLSDIGRIEMLRGNHSESLGPLEKSLDLFKSMKEEIWQAIIYIEIGNVYYFLKDYDKAIENYEESLAIAVAKSREDFMAANYGNIGACYMEKGNFQTALDYLQKGNDITSRVGSINNLIISHNDLGDIHYKLKNYQLAKKNHSRAIVLADSISALDVLEDGYLARSKDFEALGNLRSALEDQRQYQKVHDSVFNIEKSKQVDELKTKYETEKKEQQIALQEKEITVLEQKAEISTLQKILLAGLLVLSLIGSYGIRQKLKRNKLEKEKVDIELAFKQRELTTHALHLAKKNELLEALKLKAQELKKKESSKNGYQQLIRTINFDLQDDNNWENFSRYFEEVHKDFNSNVKSKYPQVTSNELRLLALLKMNLSSKEIANILNISSEGIKKARYRLRKKLDITTEDSLQDIVLNL